MTEFRIVLDYVANIVLPDSRYMGVYQDGIEVSQSLLTPPSTLLSLLLLVAMMAVAFFIRKKMRQIHLLMDLRQYGVR